MTLPAPPRRHFASLAAWCQECGFTLERQSSSGRGYTISWRDARTRELCTGEAARIADVAPFVEEKIDSGAARRPGVWYLVWSVANLSPRSLTWCRWRRWVHVYIVEGGIPGRPCVRNNGQRIGDPTPYPSAEACLAASGMLGLEFGGRLGLSAQVTPAGGGTRWLPTPECTPEALEELVRDCVRSAPRAHSVQEVAKRLQLATCLDRTTGESRVQELLEDECQVWDREIDASGEKRAFLKVAEEEGSAELLLLHDRHA